MEFLKKIFSTKIKDNDMPLPERYPENSIGDFYVENQVCITCGAPEAEAPDLIEHSKLEYGHCYFKKQPTTADELDRAINAMQVSCIAGIRYGGKDKGLLKRLYDLGLEAECDYKLEDLE
ncbi:MULTISPECIES: ferredoxin [unclassified Pedobacter]|uniref:ferredoxin n=1 Tax=unclassified Pedobacter TaxID=2628915 RepID=UPI001E3E56C7|nr:MULTISPECIES: ferredoxin [unclassified Pedobacter]